MVCLGLCPGSEGQAKSLERALGKGYSDFPPSKPASRMVAQRWDSDEALVPEEWVPKAPLPARLCREAGPQLSPHTQGFGPSRTCYCSHKNKLSGMCVRQLLLSIFYGVCLGLNM